MCKSYIFGFRNIERQDVSLQPSADIAEPFLGDLKHVFPTITTKKERSIIRKAKDFATVKLLQAQVINVYEEQRRAKNTPLWYSIINSKVIA